MDPYLQILAAVGVICALLLAKRVLRRGAQGSFKGRRPAKFLEALERLPLNPQLSVHVIRIGQRHLAIAAHGAGVTILDEWEEGARSEEVRPELKIHLAGVAGQPEPFPQVPPR